MGTVAARHRTALGLLSAAAACLLVVVVTAAAVMQLREAEDRRAREGAAERARAGAGAVERELGTALTVMGEARAILAVPAPSDEARVADLVRGPLASGSPFVALTWNPRVTASERPAFEARMGRPITEVAVRDLRDAAPRAEYLPVARIFGRSSGDYRGVDEASLPAMGEQLARARDTGGPVLAGPLPLGPGGAATARVYLPAYRGGIAPGTVPGRRAGLVGVVGGSIDVGRLQAVVRSAAGDGARLDTAPAAPAGAGQAEASVIAPGAIWSVGVPVPPASRLGSTLAAAGGLAVVLLAGLVAAALMRSRRLGRRLEERAASEARLRRDEAGTRALAEEHAAFRSIATAIAEERPAEDVYALVAETAGRLLRAEAGAVARFDADGISRVVGRWEAEGGRGRVLRGDGALARVQASGAAERVVHERPDERRHVEVAVPVRLGDRVWGAVGASAGDVRTLAGEGAIRLVAFAELLEIGVAAADARRRLADQASTDALTGLANHRAFHERLRTEVARARRHGRPLALALIDLDHFKQVNDTHGHQAGDHVLTEVAATLSRHARAGDVLARVGGEEFAWLMPETDDLAAYAAAERARQAIAGTEFAPVGRMTVSTGVSHLEGAADGAELYRRADGALYWAKAHGRDLSCRYSPEVVAAAGPGRGDASEDAPLLGVRDLVEAREGAAGHGERVAELAARMAEALGWSAARTSCLRRAAALHDIGKVAVPEGLLRRPGPLTMEERALVGAHAELGGRMAAAALGGEGAAAIRGHHERWDGRGLPDGLGGEAIPEGARLIALAEAWDAMTTTRPYGRRRTREEAFEEVRREAGRQFCPRAVEALEAASGSASAVPRRRGEA